MTRSFFVGNVRETHGGLSNITCFFFPKTIVQRRCFLGVRLPVENQSMYVYHVLILVLNHLTISFAEEDANTHHDTYLKSLRGNLV